MTTISNAYSEVLNLIKRKVTFSSQLTKLWDFSADNKVFGTFKKETLIGSDQYQKQSTIFRRKLFGYAWEKINFNLQSTIIFQISEV